ncbi:MAG: hypothetical protein U5N58_00130 [Actinomycetota bacterium]|nr:hypothetical protein [Actinomycetota bacterium]
MLAGSSLLRIDDLEPSDVEQILHNTDSFVEVLERKVKKVPALRGKTVANIF